MSPDHAALAKELSQQPEQQLVNPADPVSLELMKRCAGESYQTGSLYLQALQDRDRAARIGSTAGIVRGTRLVNATRDNMRADAELRQNISTLHDPLPSLPNVPNRDRAGGAVLKQAGLLGALGLAAIIFWAAVHYPEEPSQTSAPRLEEGGSSEADPETPLTQPARPIAESTTNSAERAERNLGLSVSGRTVAVRSGPAMMAESADELPSGAPPEVRDPVPAGNSQDPAELAAALSQAQSPLETATSPQTVRLGRSTPTPARPPRGAPLPEAPPPELMINSLRQMPTPVRSRDAGLPPSTHGVQARNPSAAPPSQQLGPDIGLARAEGQVGQVMSVPPPLMRVPEGLPSELKLVTPLGSAAPIIVADVGSEANAGPEELSSPGSQGPDQEFEFRYVRGDAVRMRRKPRLAGQVLALYYKGDEMKVDRREAGWSHVTAIDGRFGWIASRYLMNAAPNGDIRTAGTTTQRIGRKGPPEVPRSTKGYCSSPAFIVDTAAPPAPVVHRFSPDTGAKGDGMTNEAALLLTGTAEAGSTLTVRDGETVLGTAAVDRSSAWSFAAPVLADGIHAFRAVATDRAGNMGAPSTPLEVTVDTHPPSVALSTVMNDVTETVVIPGSLTNDSTPTLFGTADPGSTVQVILSRAGSPDVVLSPELSGSKWTVAPSTQLPDGPYTVTVTATDAAGNANEVSSLNEGGGSLSRPRRSPKVRSARP